MSGRVDRLRERTPAEPMRVLTLLSTLLLVGSFLTVLYALVDVSGDPRTFAVIVLVALLAASGLSRVLEVGQALTVAAATLVVGMIWYLLVLPYDPQILSLLSSNVELVTGRSLHRIRRADLWALAVTPGPVFATWFLALRRRYGAAVLVGAAMLGYFVLSSDAGTTVTLLGVVGAAGVLGFGDLDRRSGTTAGAEHVAMALAVLVVAPLLVTVVPGGAASPISLGVGGGGNSTVERSLLSTDGQFRMAGEVALSPDVRFAVQSPEGHYWKAQTYDRYTGEGWVTTGSTTAYSDDALSPPPGPSRTIQQRFEVESKLSTMPAAWRPVQVDEQVDHRTVVSEHGDVAVSGTFSEGRSYNVTSAVSDVGVGRLREVRLRAPDEIRERYTGLPDSTPDRVAERTAAITAEATGPYETARAIEYWLETNREYSLSVDRPSGDVADAFLFEMDTGYCTYFATTMVVMLRTQGVPARLATGYTTGQRVAKNRWVVRGLDSHAWVEVYVRGAGWVTFDPTPASPRERTERNRIETARANNVSSVDTTESLRTYTEPPDSTGSFNGTANGTGADDTGFTPEGVPIPGEEPPPIDVGVGGGPVLEDIDSEGSSGTPPRDHIALGVIVIAGAIAGLRRSSVGRWAVRETRLRYQRRVDPATDVDRAFGRLEILLERWYDRPRRPGETALEYVEALDAPPAARRVAAIRHRARYAGEVSRAEADEAIDLVDELRRG